MKIYSVSELNLEARETLLSAFEYPISVKGEITDYRSSKGHQYFKLRDQAGNYTVDCVIWKNTNQDIKISDYINMQVVANVKVDFYAGFGKFQLNVFEVSEFGDGFLKKEIERLKQKLSEEGVFDNKKNIPLFPNNIGILTARDSHALKDVCSKLDERYPLANIFVYPSTVQGVMAPMSIIKQLKKINRDKKVDVILIVRGGGSLQDLMSFNDEGVVREISKSEIPTITGIGHKPDITLADYASDSSQETPTAAAVKAAPDSIVLKQDLLHHNISLYKSIEQSLNKQSTKLHSLISMLKLNAPNKRIKSFSKDFKIYTQILRKTIHNALIKEERTMENNEIRLKKVLAYLYNHNKSNQKILKSNVIFLKKSLSNKMNQLKGALKLKFQQINQSNPKNILSKGYAIIRDTKNRIIRNVASAKENVNFKIEMVDGEIEVSRKKKKDLI